MRGPISQTMEAVPPYRSPGFPPCSPIACVRPSLLLAGAELGEACLLLPVQYLPDALARGIQGVIDCCSEALDALDRLAAEERAAPPEAAEADAGPFASRCALANSVGSGGAPLRRRETAMEASESGGPFPLERRDGADGADAREPPKSAILATDGAEAPEGIMMTREGVPVSVEEADGSSEGEEWTICRVSSVGSSWSGCDDNDVGDDDGGHLAA